MHKVELVVNQKEISILQDIFKLLTFEQAVG